MDLIPICTAEEIKELDRRSTNNDPQRGFALMQQAATSLIDLVIQDSKNYIPVTYFILAGKGNNGGDGILLGSYLLDQGYTAIIFIFSKPEELSQESKLAYAELQQRDPENTHHRFITDESEIHYCTDTFNQTIGVNYIIDAILGVGIKGQPRDFIATALEYINLYLLENRNRSRIIAIDAPSGVNSTTAEVYTPAIPADLTISLGFPKLGCYFYPGKAFFSNTIVKSLDYDPTLARECLSELLFFPTNNFFRKSLPPRIINGSKFEHGVVLNFSGSIGMTGAAILSTNAAYKSGAGLVKVISETDANKIIATKAIEAVYYSYNDNASFLSTARQSLESRHQAICIGPGLGNNKKEIIDYIITNTNAPVILDADAISAYASKAKDLKKHSSEILITPHRGEYLRLFPEDFDANASALDTIHQIKKRAKELNITILFKGNPSFIVDPHTRVFIIPYGNSALATAGSGDVLTGLITGLAAQLSLRASSMNQSEISILTQAAILGAYIHARAGELASLELTEYSTTATDIANFIPLVFKELINP